jgi:hypothetical protein
MCVEGPAASGGSRRGVSVETAASDRSTCSAAAAAVPAVLTVIAAAMGTALAGPRGGRVRSQQKQQSSACSCGTVWAVALLRAPCVLTLPAALTCTVVEV